MIAAPDDRYPRIVSDSTILFDDRHQATHHVWPSVDAVVLSDDARARHDVRVEGRLPLESLLVRRPESRSLVVYLHGSLDRSKYDLPRFERLESLQHIESNLLFLADPTLYLAPALRIGWFIGTAADDVTEHYTELIRHVIDQLGIEQLVIAGASSGGYATIALAPRFPDAISIAWSPQVNVRRFGAAWAEAFRRAAFPEQPTAADLEANPRFRERVDLAELYRRLPGGNLWYVQNSGDESHVKAQSLPFEEEVGDRATFIYEHHCVGHNPPTVARVRAWIERALAQPDADPLEFALKSTANVPDFRYQ